MAKQSLNTSLVKVRVKTSAKTDRVLLGKQGALSVEVREPAKENRANTKVRELVAGYLHVPVRAVHIIKGYHMPSKLLQVVKR